MLHPPVSTGIDHGAALMGQLFPARRPPSVAAILCPGRLWSESDDAVGTVGHRGYRRGDGREVAFGPSLRRPIHIFPWRQGMNGGGGPALGPGRHVMVGGDVLVDEVRIKSSRHKVRVLEDTQMERDRRRHARHVKFV